MKRESDAMTRTFKVIVLILGIVIPIVSALAYVTDRSDRLYTPKDSFSMLVDSVKDLSKKIDELNRNINHRK